METVTLVSLWLPILLSALVVFVASAIIWMLLKWHDADWQKLPDEESARAALGGAARGEYALPYAMSAAARNSEDFRKKCEEGPVAFLTIFEPGLPKMGRQLALWFAFCIVLSWFVAYLLVATTPAGATYLHVFQVAGTAAFLGYGGSAIPASIWFGQGWGRTLKDLVDGLVYALLTAGVFGWLWPQGAAV